MPQPWVETQRRFYYQLHRTVDEQIGRVLDALRATRAYENTIVVFTSDHGDMLGAHGGMHQKWHNAYEETVHVPFVVSSPLFQGGRREGDIAHEPRGPAADVAGSRRHRSHGGAQASRRHPHRSAPPGGA